MAKFYLTDVPEAPLSKATRTRKASVPAGPYQVAGRPPQMPEINARVQSTDIAKNIPSLMQNELPREVSHGLVEGVRETGRAQARAGRASAEAALAWGKAGMETAAAFNEVAVYLQKSKDYADRSRIDNAQDTIDAEFEKEVSAGQLTAVEQMKLWPKYAERLDTQIAAMNLSAHNRDIAVPKVNVYKMRKETDLTNRMFKEQAASDTEAIDTSYKTDLQHGRIESAVSKIEDMYDAKLINAGQRDQRIAQARTAYDEWRVTTQIGSDPRYALVQLEEAVQAGHSETYKNLTPGSLITLRNQARAEVERKEIDALENVANGVARNELKNDTDIDNVAGGNVAAHRLQPYKDKVNAPVDAPYSQEAMARIETAIDTYVKEAPDTGSPEYHRIRELIINTAPKAEWERLTSDLNKKRNEDPNALPGEDWFNEIVKDVHQRAKDGAFVGVKPPMMVGPFAVGGGQPTLDMTLVNAGDTNKEAIQYRLEHHAEIEEMFAKSRSVQIQLREWRKEHPGNDHKTQDEAYKFRNDLLKTQGADAGRIPIRKAIMPSTPTTGVMGTPAPTSSSATPAGLTDSLIASVKQLEGFEPTAKWDSGQYSVGYGTRGKKGESLTEEQANARLLSELSRHAANVDRAAQAVGLKLTEGQRAALISFDFNTGDGEKLIVSSKGNLAEIARRLPSWNKEEKGGPVSKGLVNRRAAELRMFNS